MLSITTGISTLCQSYQPTWSSLDSRPVPQWYKDAKFGIFIHWGVYAVPGYTVKGNYAEWYQYRMQSGDSVLATYHKKRFGTKTYYQLADEFKAALYNPDEWAHVIEKSGAKYVVLTSKHHDGFALWPSKEASVNWGIPWNAVETGPHRDLLGELFVSLRKKGVHAGMYYSLYEWFNPLWKKDRKAYVDQHCWPQMKELINTYKPDVFWTDGDWDASDEVWKSKQFLSWLYNESPVKDKVVTVDRWGSGIRFKHGAVFTPEYQPDLEFEDHYWEESRGMGWSYGYNRDEDAWDYNSAHTMILNLIDKVSRGGNFLLDIGPDEHGKIPPIMQERLLQIGKWMDINGEAIYNTVRWRSASQWSAGNTNYKPKSGSGDLLLKLTVNPDSGYAIKECFFTYNPLLNNLYVLLPVYPSSKKITVKDFAIPTNTQIELLETHAQLVWMQKGSDIEIQLPEFDPNKIKSEYAFVIKLQNCGAYAAKPKLTVAYIGNSLKPTISIETKNAECRYTLDGNNPTQESMLYTNPFIVDSASTVYVRCFKNGIFPGAVVGEKIETYTWQNPVSTFTTPVPGLAYKAYELESDSVNDLRLAKPVKSGECSTISLNDSTRSLNFGLEFEGFFKATKDAVYTFYLTSDDGSKLWMDGNTLIDNDGLHGDVEKWNRIALKKGLHRIKLAFAQAGGAATLRLLYSTGDEMPKEIETENLFH